ncbi:HAD-like domain-containing protein [Fimicolochytrium jonesii]|uniref:HAD-like domain-containing protein n=1 Tax=Fimicolochytrium jonesii TaxID=1396493 RepID=UPI0022FE147F|nr:HAD-like domain-containing protein [Fimicolochytrium jonesii]KAI8821672.1 HAD-like domain-containing protein [Fimicolochytrium jonesii]
MSPDNSKSELGPLPAHFKKENVRVICCDIDGTTIRKDHTVSKRTINAFHYLRKNHPDVQIMFATGRPASAAGNIAPLLKDETDGKDSAPKGKGNAVIGVYLNGSLVLEHADGTVKSATTGIDLTNGQPVEYDPSLADKVTGGDTSFKGPWYAYIDTTRLHILHERRLLPKDAIWYLNYAETYNLTIIAYCGNEIVTPNRYDAVFEHTFAAGEPRAIYDKDLKGKVERGELVPHKFALVSMDFARMDDVERSLGVEEGDVVEAGRDGKHNFIPHASLGPRPRDTTKLLRLGKDRLEVMHVDASKAAALQTLCKSNKLGTGKVSMSHVMAFGDGFNDIEMVQEAGMGVAMANGEEPLRKIADFVSATNDEDGVARVLEKVFDIEWKD